MTLGTLVRYLFGSRAAILEIAATRRAVWLGLMFILSAGFAREYDGEDLLHEPWHLALPLGASLATSFLLYWLICTVGAGRSESAWPFGSTYRSFLGLYWMTAPLAWLYAVPVERFLSAAEATAANLWLLALVSVWRVALMTRVVSVLFGTSGWAALFIVMLFADTVALVLLFLTPLPVIVIMGGIRLSESERVLQNAAVLVGFAGVVTWPVWCLGTWLVASISRKTWRHSADAVPRRGVSVPLWGVAVLSVAVWGAVLPFTQPEQQLRRRVEDELHSGRIAQGLATMSAYGPEAFPPHWEPPPRIGFGDNTPPLLDVMDRLIEDGAAEWVRERYVEKFTRRLGHHDGSYGVWSGMDDKTLARYLHVLEGLPEGRSLAALHQEGLRQFLFSGPEHPPAPELRARILALLPTGPAEEESEATEHP